MGANCADSDRDRRCQQVKTMSRDDTEKRLRGLVGRVQAIRRKMFTLNILKLFAVCGLWVVLYAALYAWLDHRMQFGIALRLAALVVFGIGLITIILQFSRLLLAHRTCSQVANFIEGQSPCDQQLVAAIEYYEQGENYAYSQDLAHCLVRQADATCSKADFNSIVPAWQRNVCLVIVLLGAYCTFLFLQNNYVFFSRYFSRLTQPLAAIEPLPSTVLRSLSGDIAAAPDRPFRVSAEIEGLIPDTADLIVEKSKTGEAEAENDHQTIPLFPAESDDGKTQLGTELTLAVGDYRYRFESGEAMSEWHLIDVSPLPEIASLEAEIVTQTNNGPRTQHQKIENYTLSVFKDSLIKLTATTTEPINKATSALPLGETKVLELPSARTFEISFKAKEDGVVQFQLTALNGLINNRLPALQITLLEDEPPALSCISPGGDIMATVVSSIPVTFTAEDDYGLQSAELVFEITAQDPWVVPFKFKPGVPCATQTHILELEDYDLSVGDSILYYARAKEANSGYKKEAATACSDMFLIEIKPYMQIWHPNRAACQSGDGQAPADPGKLHDSLKYVLEYSRAILKKTWAIASKETLNDEDNSKMDSIRSDAGYAAGQLSLIRDDPQYAFTIEQREMLNYSVDQLMKACAQLARHKPKEAIEPETNAYQTLRKLLIETDRKLCPPGGALPERPDRVVVDENIHLTRHDIEKIKQEANQLADRIEQLHDQQKKEYKRYDHFLKNNEKNASRPQKTTDEKTWIADVEDQTNRPASKQDPNMPSGINPPQPPITLEGALDAIIKSGSPPPGGGGAAAKASDRLVLFQAKEKMLQERVQELMNELERMKALCAQQSVQQGISKEKIENALKALEEADQRIEDFLEQASASQFNPEDRQRMAEASRDSLEKAAMALGQGKDSMNDATSSGQDGGRSEEYRQRAEDLQQLADELERTLDAKERREKLAQLEKAQQDLQQAAKEQSRKGSQGKSSGQQQGSQQGRSQGQQQGNQQSASQGQGQGSGGPGEGHQSTAIVYGNWAWDGLEPEEAARFLAQAYFSLAIAADGKETVWIDEPASDADFYTIEKDFFERAAHFGPVQE